MKKQLNYQIYIKYLLTQATKSKFEVLIKDKDKYTPKQLRDEMVKLLIPKGKGVEYFETMVANNTKALDQL